MIISVNPKPSLEQFKILMSKTDYVLNEDASRRPAYYKNRNGVILEDDVKDALEECARGTSFEGTIEKISGHRFPDIVASKLYGVEVKSTKDDNWKSTGSSIMESTRIDGVERIYMTFGKLGGNPIVFLSKPYEKCLYDIAVTHMPRYLIDMQLEEGSTIFDKMGIPYDELRKMENPIAPVAKYYKGTLKEGESLWWANDSADEAVSATVRLWDSIGSTEKRYLTLYGCFQFPEIFAGHYDRFALWLVTSKGIVNTHIRDLFSAGGKEEMLLSSGMRVKFPGVFRRIKNDKPYFIEIVKKQGAPNKSLEQRLLMWCDMVSRHTVMEYDITMDALKTMFKDYI